MNVQLTESKARAKEQGKGILRLWAQAMQAEGSRERAASVAAHVAEDLQKAYGERFEGGNPDVLKGLVENNCMGRKSKKGLFVYADGSKDRPLNQEAMNLIKKFALVAPPSTATDEDIVLRMVTR